MLTLTTVSVLILHQEPASRLELAAPTFAGTGSVRVTTPGSAAQIAAGPPR